MELVFIRAPHILEVSNKVTILCNLNENIVAAKEDNILITSFHPELTNDTTFLKYFIEVFCSFLILYLIYLNFIHITKVILALLLITSNLSTEL